MDEKLKGLSIGDSPDVMNIDTPSSSSFNQNSGSPKRDQDGDMIMDDSISHSPSLPLRYHNYFNVIKKVNLGKTNSKTLESLQDMKSRIEEIDKSLNLLENTTRTLGNSKADPADSARTFELDNNKLLHELPENTSLIKSILSPTMLGARMAYNTSPSASPKLAGKSGSYSPIPDKNGLQLYGSNKNRSLVRIDSYSGGLGLQPPTEIPQQPSQVIQTGAQVPAQSTPQQLVNNFQLHHHHYYYPPDSQITTHKDQDETQPQDLVLLPSTSNFNDLPYYISTYLQLFLNILITCYALSLVYGLVNGIKLDIDLKLKDKVTDLMIELDKCREHFEENKCFKDTIIPAIRDQCSEWEKCMYRDPFSTSGKLVITLQLIGMIINSLIEPISLRSCFVLAMVVGILFLLNFSFGFLRLKIYFNSNEKKHE